MGQKCPIICIMSLFSSVSKFASNTSLSALSSSISAGTAVSRLQNTQNLWNRVGPVESLLSSSGILGRNKTVAKLRSLQGRFTDIARPLTSILEKINGDNIPKVTPSAWKDIYNQIPVQENTLDSLRARTDPSLACRWTATILDSSSTADPNKVGTGKFIDAIDVPHIAVDSNSVYRNGKTITYAGKIELQNINLVFYGDSDGNSVTYATNWLALCFDKEHNVFNLPSIYKKDIKITLLNPIGTPILDYILYGCFPLSYSTASLANTSEIANVTLSISVDDVQVYRPKEYPIMAYNAATLAHTKIKAPAVPTTSLNSIEGAKDAASRAVNNIRTSFSSFHL